MERSPSIDREVWFTYSKIFEERKESKLTGQKEKTFRAAAVQLSPLLFDRDGTTEKVLKGIEKCGQEGIRLAVFPETVIPNYPYFAWVNPPAVIAELHGRLFEQAVEIPGPVTEAVGKAAKASGTVVVLGVNERDGGSLYNTQLIIYPSSN